MANARTVLAVPTQSGACAVIELQGEVRCVGDAEEHKVIGCSVSFCHATMSAWFLNYHSSVYNSFEISVSFDGCEGTMRVTKLPKEKEERLSATAKTFVLDEAEFAVDSALENFSSLWVYLYGNFWKSACCHITSTCHCQPFGNFVGQTRQEAVSSIAKAIKESGDKNESFGLLLNRIGEFYCMPSGNILLDKLLEMCQMSMSESRYERSLGSSEMVSSNPFLRRAQMSTKHSASRESLLSIEPNHDSGSDHGSFPNMEGTKCFSLPEDTLLLDPAPILTRSLPTPQRDLSHEPKLSHSSLVDPTSQANEPLRVFAPAVLPPDPSKMMEASCTLCQGKSENLTATPLVPETAVFTLQAPADWTKDYENSSPEESTPMSEEGTPPFPTQCLNDNSNREELRNVVLQEFESRPSLQFLFELPR